MLVFWQFPYVTSVAKGFYIVKTIFSVSMIEPYRWTQKQVMSHVTERSRGLVYLEETMVVNHSILVVQQRKERVLCMQQHLPLPLFLSLSSTVHTFFQRQDLTQPPERLKSLTRRWQWHCSRRHRVTCISPFFSPICCTFTFFNSWDIHDESSVVLRKLLNQLTWYYLHSVMQIISQ